jgi:hypothetical protein
MKSKVRLQKGLPYYPQTKNQGPLAKAIPILTKLDT